jgi:hypothetical protein
VSSYVVFSTYLKNNPGVSQRTKEMLVSRVEREEEQTSGPGRLYRCCLPGPILRISGPFRCCAFDPSTGC